MSKLVFAVEKIVALAKDKIAFVDKSSGHHYKTKEKVKPSAAQIERCVDEAIRENAAEIQEAVKAEVSSLV